LSIELGKEMRLREALEMQQVTFTAALAEKETEIRKLHDQLNSVDKLMTKNEALEVENKVRKTQLFLNLSTLKSTFFRQPKIK